MKRIAGIISACIGAAAAVAYFADRVYCTDAATGLVIAGSVWLRYAIAVILLVLAAAVAVTVSPQAILPQGGSPVFAASLLTAVCCVCGAVFGCGADGLGGRAVTAVLLMLAALRLLSCAAFQIRGGEEPAGGVLLGVAGSLYPFLLVLQRFAANESSFYRFAQTLGVYSALCALVFSTALIRADCLPGTVSSRRLCFYGMLCFFFCFCFEVPECAACVQTGICSLPELFTHLILGGFGLLGLCTAMRALWARFTPDNMLIPPAKQGRHSA